MNLAVGHISPALQKSSGKRSDATALKRRKLTHLGVLARPFSRLPRRKTRGDPSLTEKSRKGKMPYQEKVRNGSGHERGKKAVRERRSFWARDQFCSLRRSEDPVEVDISAAQADRGTSTSGVLNPVGRASSNGKVSTSSSAAAASPCPLTDFLLEGVAAFEARHAGFVPRGNARFDVRRQLVHVGEDSVRQGLAGLLNALEIAEEVIDELSDLLDLKDDVLAKGVTSTSSGAVDERSKKKTKNTAALRKDEQKRQQARLEAKLRRLKFLTEVQREGRERKDGMVGTAERETWLDYLKTGTLEITAAYAAMFIVMKVYQHPVVLRVPRRALSNPVFLTFGNL
ncbi:unnamed protein product [Amoebophrya sp. A120]|nr:unnamed protein product [Amoebophrya sp. A120]|eukprot:GSA120T00003428001.1